MGLTVSGSNSSDCGTMSEDGSIANGSGGGAAAPISACAVAVGAVVSSVARARTAVASAVAVEGSPASGSGIAGVGKGGMLGEGASRLTGASGGAVAADWRPVYDVTPTSVASEIPAAAVHPRTARRLPGRTRGTSATSAGERLLGSVVDCCSETTRTPSDSRAERVKIRYLPEFIGLMARLSPPYDTLSRAERGSPRAGGRKERRPCRHSRDRFAARDPSRW